MEYGKRLINILTNKRIPKGKNPRGGGRRHGTWKIWSVLILVTALGCGAVLWAWQAYRPIHVVADGMVVKLYLVQQQKTVTLPMEQYLVGAVAAEMPPTYPLQALEAQAVAARTFAYHRMVPQSVANSVEKGADISDTPPDGQAWISQSEMRTRWGRAYTYYYLKVLAAVFATRGMVITYGGQPIDAAYFASSGNKGTESARDIWGVDVPYLQSVAPLTGEKPSPSRVFTYTLGTMDSLMGTDLAQKPYARVLSHSSSGRPLVIQLGDVAMQASRLTQVLGLPSTYCSFWLHGDELSITTLGSGQGVGMCQAGAAAMAQKGADFRDIIRHYYKDVQIVYVPGI